MTQEKPWWMESPFCETYRVPQFDGSPYGVTLNQSFDMEAIVAEAHRRGKLEAWNEARELCDEYRDAIDEEIEKVQNEEEKAANRV